MVVIITVILVPMATYLYQRSIIRAKEYVLKNNLSILRMVIHQYSHDKGKAPQTLHNLQEEGYLRDIPIDVRVAVGISVTRYPPAQIPAGGITA
jgi:general secretion pathway protein G